MSQVPFIIMENTTAEPTSASATAPGQLRERNRFLWVMAGALIVATVFGAAWGLLRPAQSVVVVEGGMRLNSDTLDAGFVALVWASAGAVVLSVLLALWAFFRLPERRRAGTLWLITLIAAISAWIAIGAGDAAGAIRQPNLQEVEIGDSLSLLPAVTSIPIVLYAAFTAAIVYWVCLLISPDRDETDESAPEPENAGA